MQSWRVQKKPHKKILVLTYDQSLLGQIAELAKDETRIEYLDGNFKPRPVAMKQGALSRPTSRVRVPQAHPSGFANDIVAILAKIS